MASNLKLNKFFQFVPLNSNGPKVVYHVAFVLNDILYIHGGLTNKNDKLPSNQLFKFDFKSGWLNITPSNSPALSNHCAVVQGNYILFIGGWDGSSRLSDVYVYDTIKGDIQKAKTSGFPAGAGLSSHTCNNLSDNSILIFGREGSLRIQRKYGNCFILKGLPESLVFKYEELELDTASRSGHISLNMNRNQLIVIGGRKDKVVEIHSFKTNENNSLINDNKINSYLVSILSDKNSDCKCLKNEPGGRRFAAGIKIGDFCLLHAGETFDSHFRDPQQDLLLLKFTTLKWYSLGDTGINLQNHSISCLDNRLIIHGGLSIKGKTNDTTYELCPLFT